MPSIAIIGASNDRSKFGNKAVRAYAQKGFTVYAIHPSEPTIEGIKAFRSLIDVPAKKSDRVSFYLPPQIGIKVIADVAKKEVDEVWLNPGAESDEIVALGEKLGLNMISACSIVDIGLSPSEFR